ncbi:MAG TPA: transposase [Acidobacteriota bacterium]|nr:transposase [Acidobacteriota bacterium]
MTKARRSYTAELKAQIVRRHLADKVPVSDLADEYHIQPTQIHGWVKQVLDQAERAFLRKPRAQRKDRSQQIQQQRIAHLEQKLVQKNEVISELMEENVRAKKANGEL